MTPSFNASLDASAYLTATLTAIVNGHKQSRFLASVGTGVLTSALASDFAGPKARVVCPTIISCGVYPPSHRAALNDQSVTVTTCGRICYKRKKINLSLVFAGQAVGIKQVEDHIWLASFMD
ncbi:MULTISPECIES: hypothetical protein [Rhizobium]|uniref:Uncharacterized protein n=1 Tax=Rhizobium esperanzae TaxID=1967781 RepID=A0A7W6UJ85_9HYPH|nr:MULTISPECIES: hypothetical protein [Rhizobium]MBB4439218.1 hypothetical protein [Rhizobium esperanzae]MDH6201822.1 hypothetical protein [Rhizobium leguminosarum]